MAMKGAQIYVDPGDRLIYAGSLSRPGPEKALVHRARARAPDLRMSSECLPYEPRRRLITRLDASIAGQIQNKA